MLISFVEVGFASESNINPASMVGHSFLILNGFSNANKLKHSFEYLALTGNNSFLLLKGVFTRLSGAYRLAPFYSLYERYIGNEQRSIWRFRINLTDSEILKLKNHLWELKDKNISYSIATYNCGTAIENILKAVNVDFAYNDNIIKRFMHTLVILYHVII